MIGFGGRGKLGVFFEVYLEIVPQPVFRALGHGVFGVENVKEVMVFFWYGFPEFCISFHGRREVFLGGMAQGYFVDVFGEVVITVQAPFVDVPLFPVKLYLVEATPGESK